MTERLKATKLDLAIDEIKRYFGVKTQSDIFNLLVESDASNLSEKARELIAKQFDKLDQPLQISSTTGIPRIVNMIQSQQSGFFAHEIITAMETLSSGKKSKETMEKLNGLFTVVYENTDKKFTSKSKINPGTCTKISALTAYANELKVTNTPDPKKYVNQAPTAPTKEKPALSAFVVNSNKLNPSSRNSSAPELFFNAIPTIEMSRCVPFLDITIIPSQPTVDKKGNKTSLSILQFLDSSQHSPSSATHKIGTSIDSRVKKNVFSNSTSKGKGAERGTAGMEIFTSPQTFVNGNETFAPSATRNAPVIDKFRPLASIRSFKVNLAPSQGLIAYKTADLQITLHDRSRLSEVSDFVKPDLFGHTEMLITYGWSHPDGNVGTNVYGRFLDQLKCTEKYSIVNSSFSFDAVGQVNINLKLALKGTPALNLQDITDDDAADNSLKSVALLAEAIKSKRKVIGSIGKKKGSKSISGSSILGKLSDTNSIMRLNAESIKKVKAFIAKARKSNNPDVKALVKDLTDLIGYSVRGKSKKGKDGKKKKGKLYYKQGALQKAQKSMAQLAAKKIAKLEYNRINELDEEKKETKTGNYKSVDLSKKYQKKKDQSLNNELRTDIHDPFMLSIKKNFVNIEESNNEYVSFGSLILQYVGYPLARSGQFDEVQFVFYQFNDSASYVRGMPISSFPIYFPDFEEVFSEASKTTTKMSLQRFIKLMSSKFISSQTSRAYGLRDTIYENDKETGKLKVKEMYKEMTLMKGEKDLRLEDAYGKDSELRFKVPRIQIHAECLDGPNADQTIYRIHVFDSNCSAFSSLAKIISASDDSKLEAFTNNIGKIAAKSKKKSNKGKLKVSDAAKADYAKQLKSALDNGIIEAIGKTTNPSIEQIKSDSKTLNFRVIANFDKVKKHLIQRMPSIIYGTSNSNITQANLGSMNTPALTNIHMRNSGLGKGNTPAGLRATGLPLQVSPMKLTIQSMGMPFVVIGQQFFIDFGTGTSADNIYVAAKVRHEVSQGKFTSSIDFHPLNAYGQYTNLGNQIQHAIKELQN